MDENPSNLFAKAINEAQAELDRLARAQAEARAKLVALRQAALPATAHTALVQSAEASTTSSPPQTAADKVRLFRERFRGRPDVFPRRWENARSGKSGYSPACANEWVRGVCGKPKTRCSECSSQAFVPLDDSVVLGHLNGDHTIGVYPLLPGDTCWFVAADFDEVSWKDDVLAFAETCRAIGLPVAVERSRSGNGAHAWFFFAEPVAACHARRMASFVLTETMSRRTTSAMPYKRTIVETQIAEGGHQGLGQLLEPVCAPRDIRQGRSHQPIAKVKGSCERECRKETNVWIGAGHPYTLFLRGRSDRQKAPTTKA